MHNNKLKNELMECLQNMSTRGIGLKAINVHFPNEEARDIVIHENNHILSLDFDFLEFEDLDERLGVISLRPKKHRYCVKFTAATWVEAYNETEAEDDVEKGRLSQIKGMDIVSVTEAFVDE